jgi:glycosyltransferase involved in cell wall biosynthesis
MADVFCFPSKTDTFGIVLIEAMSLGLPVAAYPVTGPIDIVEPGVSGILGDSLADAIRQAATLNRRQVEQSSQKWTWQQAWEIFSKHLEKK